MPLVHRVTNTTSGSASAADRARQAAVLAGAAAQLAVPVVLRRADARSLGRPNPFVMPVPGTFAIWAPIMVLGAAHGVVQARPGAAADPVLRGVGWPVAAAFASTGAWAPLVVGGRWWPAQGAIASLAGFAGLAARRLAEAERGQRGGPGREGWLVRMPVALLAGWGAAATGINLASMLAAGRPAAQRPAALTAIGVLGAAGAAGVRAAGVRTVAARVFGASVLWALGGVAAGQRARFPAGAGAALTSAVAVAAALAVPDRARVSRTPRGRALPGLARRARRL